MSEVITVATRKGGVGKTATAWGLGTALARMGFSVLFIDMDGQRSLSRQLSANPDRPTSYDVLTGRKSARMAIQTIACGDLMAASPMMDDLGQSLTGAGANYRLKEALGDVPGRYDVTLIDTPPTLGAITLNALTASSGVIVPATPDIMAYQGMEETLNAIQEVRRYANPSLEVLGIVISDWDGRPALNKQIAQLMETRAQSVPTRVYSTKIRHGIALKEAQAACVNLFDYAPKSNPAQDYMTLAKEVAEQIGLKGA